MCVIFIVNLAWHENITFGILDIYLYIYIHKMFFGVAIDYLNSLRNVQQATFLSKWILESDRSCPNSHVGGINGPHTHTEWWADGISSVPTTSPLSVFLSGPVQQQMSAGNRWPRCMFKCVLTAEGREHEVKLSERSVRMMQSYVAWLYIGPVTSLEQVDWIIWFVKMNDNRLKPVKS